MEFEGAFYHVIVRGNQRRRIFRDEHDRLYYLKGVEHYGSAINLEFTLTF